VADQWTPAQLDRIAKALQLTGYNEAGAFVALAAGSVRTVSTLKSCRKRDIRNSSRPTDAMTYTSRSLAIVVPFPSRRGIDRK